MGMCHFNGLLFHKKSSSTKIFLNMCQFFKNLQNAITPKNSEKLTYISRKIPENGSPFLPKWPLKVGTRRGLTVWGSSGTTPSKPNLGTPSGLSSYIYTYMICNPIFHMTKNVSTYMCNWHSTVGVRVVMFNDQNVKQHDYTFICCTM